METLKLGVEVVGDKAEVSINGTGNELLNMLAHIIGQLSKTMEVPERELCMIVLMALEDENNEIIQ